MKQCEKLLYCRTDHRRQCGACALYTGHLRLKTGPQST